MDIGRPVVLIVDDDVGVQRSLSRLIRAAGWTAEAFSSAREFMESLPSFGAACVLLDIRMPGLTGPQLHAWMADKGISLPVVFLTGHGDVPTSVQAMKRGAVDFLLKPVDDQVLLETIRQAFTLHAAEKSREDQQQEIKERHSRLTAREREVMGQVIVGRLNKQIAADLGISLKTVKVHRARAMEKMEVRSVAALVHVCETAGIASCSAD
jgi:FixJ family two-component response regulator